MKEIKALISLANTYYQEKNKQKALPNVDLLTAIAEYVTKLLQMFGVYQDHNPLIGPPSNSKTEMNNEEIILPYATTLSEFRDNIRLLAQSKAGNCNNYYSNM